MNGELIPWADAQIHVLTHTLHYGTGVFEGIRVRDRARPGGVPAHRAHRAAVRLGQDHDDGHPLHGRPARAGDEGHGALDRTPVVLRPADRVLRLRRDGAQHVAVWGRRRDRLLAVGRVSRRRRRLQGRAHEDLELDAPRPQHDAAAVEDDGQLRELVAREGRGAQSRVTTRRSCSIRRASCPSAPARTSSRRGAAC